MVTLFNILYILAMINNVSANIELESLMFIAVRTYYGRDPVQLRCDLDYLASLPRYLSFCMRCAWWKRFLIDANAYLENA